MWLSTIESSDGKHLLEEGRSDAASIRALRPDVELRVVEPPPKDGLFISTRLVDMNVGVGLFFGGSGFTGLTGPDRRRCTIQQ